MLRRYNMEDSKPVGTALPPGTVYAAASEFEVVDDATILQFQTMLGSASYCKEMSRPDVVSGIHQLAKVAHRPGRDHVEGMRHLLKYFNGARSRRLRYRPDGGGLYMYSDASLATDTDTRKSVSGIVVLLAGAAVLWVGAKQPLVSTSSAHAEIQSYTHGAKENAMQLKYAKVFRLNVNIPASPTSELYNPFAVMPRMKLVPLDSVPVDQ